jgi:hypothetical protein
MPGHKKNKKMPMPGKMKRGGRTKSRSKSKK